MALYTKEVEKMWPENKLLRKDMKNAHVSMENYSRQQQKTNNATFIKARKYPCKR